MMVYAPVPSASEGSVYTPNSPITAASPLGSPNQLLMSGAYSYPSSPYAHTMHSGVNMNSGVGYHMMPTAMQQTAMNGMHMNAQPQSVYQGHGELGVGFVDCSGSTGGNSDCGSESQKALPLTYGNLSTFQQQMYNAEQKHLLNQKRSDKHRSALPRDTSHRNKEVSSGGKVSSSANTTTNNTSTATNVSATAASTITSDNNNDSTAAVSSEQQ
jgi:hypothetical protein